MHNDPSFPSIHTSERIERTAVDSRSPCWGAVIAGLVAAMGVHFLLLMLGTAAGLGAVEPVTDDNPVASFGMGAAIVWSISALISMGVGGWVAGRCAVRVHSVSGGVHGFLVWSLATIITLFLVTSGTTKLASGSAQLVGQGLSAAGEAAGGAAEMAKAATEESTSLINSFVEEATESRGRDIAPAQVIAARREIGQAARRLFAEGGDLRDPEARSAVVQAMQKGTGTSEADANRMVDGWIASMESARQNLEQMKEAAVTKAREVADQSAEAFSKAAWWTFVGFLLGALAATFGGRTGARWEYSHTELAADPNFDPANRRGRTRVLSTPATGTV